MRRLTISKITEKQEHMNLHIIVPLYEMEKHGIEILTMKSD